MIDSLAQDKIETWLKEEHYSVVKIDEADHSFHLIVNNVSPARMVLEVYQPRNYPYVFIASKSVMSNNLLMTYSKLPPDEQANFVKKISQLFDKFKLLHHTIRHSENSFQFTIKGQFQFSSVDKNSFNDMINYIVDANQEYVNLVIQILSNSRNDYFLVNLLEKCWSVHTKLNNYSKKFIEQKHPSLNSFAMVYNNITMVIELLQLYNDSMSRISNGEPIQRIGYTEPPTLEAIKKETLERVTEITKWSFVHAVSSYEHTSKTTLIYYKPQNFQDIISKLNAEKKVYLNDIMKKSHNKGIISAQDYEKWKQIIFIRNCVVHNNAISDSTKKIKINDIEVDCKKNKMIRASRSIFVSLVDATTDLYYNWVMLIK